ncbi:MAG: hypothetical protein ABI554_12955 [Flavobacterium sp.]
MIDYTKIYLIGINANRLLLLDNLDFKYEVSEKTGLLSSTLTAEYHHCKIIIKENSKDKSNPHVSFSGSIHKMWNSRNGILAPNYNKNKPYKGFNGNQFSLKDIIDIRTHLEKLFDCTASQMDFKNIEFGVNTTVVFNPTIFLKGLLYHEGIKFEFQYKDNYSQAEHERYILKIYNKSSQYGMNGNVLRIELKFVRMEDLKPLGIKTFADINSSTLEQAKDLLLKKFDEVVYYDYTIKKKKLSERNLELLKNYANPRYWIEDLKPNRRDRPKKELYRLILEYSINLHQQIKTKIIEKCVMINRLFENNKKDKCVMINHSSIGLNVTQSTFESCSQKKVFCSITKLDISMQKYSSNLLSHTGLKYYYTTDKKVFEQIKRKYLSKQWQNSDFQLQIKEIAHNIRNTKSNQTIKQKSIYKPYQINLLSG